MFLLDAKIPACLWKQRCQSKRDVGENIEIHWFRSVWSIFQKIQRKCCEFTINLRVYSKNNHKLELLIKKASIHSPREIRRVSEKGTLSDETATSMDRNVNSRRMQSAGVTNICLNVC